jgi:hypothetical protein
MVLPAESLLSKDPTQSYRTNPAVRCRLLKSEMRCDHLEPELLIAIKDQVFVRRFKGKCLAQLLDDPTASRMLRDVNVQDCRSWLMMKKQ